MNESVSDQVELALFTLARFLPYGYAKESTLDIVNSAVKYISILNENIQEPEIKCEPMEPIPPVVSNDSPVEISGSLVDLGGAEENLILQELGLGVLYDSDTFSEIFSESDSKLSESETKLVTLPSEDIKQISPPIKRPPNGFIRYASQTRTHLIKTFPKKDNREISKHLGHLWRKLPAGEKRRYSASFSREIMNIKAKFPEWNYAASRAKCNNVAANIHQGSQILSSRLRKQPPKNYKKMSGFESTVGVKKPKLGKVKKEASDVADTNNYSSKPSPENYKMMSGMELIMSAKKPKREKVKKVAIDNDIDCSPKPSISHKMISEPKFKKLQKKAVADVATDYTPKGSAKSEKKLATGFKKSKLENFKKEEAVANHDNYYYSPNLENVDTPSFKKIEDALNESLLPLKKRKGNQTMWAECVVCNKWRKLPSRWKISDVPVPWYCFLNPDEMYRYCAAPQEIP